MPRTDERKFGVARLYARAMLTVARERDEAEGLGEELAALGDLLREQPDFARFLESPLADGDRRRGSLERLFRGRGSDLLVDALQVINRKGRLGLLPAVIEAYRQELLAAAGMVDVEVTTAAPLSAELRQRLQAAADRFTGKKARLVEAVRPEILGGLILQVGDDKFDASVARKLEKLSAALMHRATEEILTGRSPLATS